MILVSDALAHLFALTKQLPVETVPLSQANGRTLATPVSANRDQPPFSASAMDGYAIVAEGAEPGKSYEVSGESAAGHAFKGTVAPGQAVRIFTGAPVPEGAARVIIQEDVTRDGDIITLGKKTRQRISYPALGWRFQSGSDHCCPTCSAPV
jgi:molybdopterin molybdotransferase